MNCECRLRLAQEFADDRLFDEGVEAARNACVAGAPLASAAITASAWYNNPLTGVPALRASMQRVADLEFDVESWRSALTSAPHEETSDPNFTPGFGFVDSTQRELTLRAAERLSKSHARETRGRLPFFVEHQAIIALASGPLNLVGLAALVFVDHGVELDAAERIFLLLRIEVALAEAATTRRLGIAAFPFFSQEYVYEGVRPDPCKRDLASLMREVGLD